MLNEHHHQLNRWPARWDMLQGLTALFMVLFMWAHMLLVSSILLGMDAMNFVARMFEGVPLFGKPYPLLISGVALLVFTIIFIHAFLALRKFPASYREYHALNQHLSRFRHPDTLLWYVQVLTGFVLFFLIPVHLYQMLMHPADIGPYASSDRVWSGRMWPLYLILLLAVEFHAAIGIYRLVIKWGLFLGNNPKRARARLKMVKWLMSAFLIILGLMTLAAYAKIGYDHAPHAGERYVPGSTETLP